MGLSLTPSTDMRSQIRQGLLSRGLAPHIADAFIMNFQDESGLNPGINEIAPLVPGSRGGFGLYQLTGPRRVAYEQFAKQRGVNPADVDAQLDFMMMELQGPESRAAKSIFSAPDTGSAAAAIVTNFLRPAEEHRNRRVAKYTGGMSQPNSGTAPPMQGILSTSSPQTEAPMEEQKATGLLGSLFPNMTADRQDRLAVALSGLSMFPNQGVMQMAGQRMADRRDDRKEAKAQAAERQRANVTAQWLAQQPGGQQYAQAIASGALPASAALSMWQAASQGQEPVKGVEINGRLVNPYTGQEIADYSQGQTQEPRTQIAKLQADLNDGLISQEQYQMALESIAAKDGMAIDFTPDGGFSYRTGAATDTKPLTEGQSKDTTYATRAEGSLPLLNKYDTELASFGQRALDIDPTGIVRSRVQSPEYQMAKQAGDEFLQAILRKDTGAAITADEQVLYGTTYLPQPGDGPEVIEQKRQARIRALEALKAGMPPSAIIQQEKALSRSGGSPAGMDFSTMSAADLSRVDVMSLTSDQLQLLQRRFDELGL